VKLKAPPPPTEVWLCWYYVNDNQGKTGLASQFFSQEHEVHMFLRAIEASQFSDQPTLSLVRVYKAAIGAWDTVHSEVTVDLAYGDGPPVEVDDAPEEPPGDDGMPMGHVSDLVPPDDRPE